MSQVRRGRRKLRMKTSTVTGLQKVKKDIRQIKRRQKSNEWKFGSFSNNDAVVSTTGTVQIQMFTFPLGTKDTERIGRKITLTSMQVRFLLTLPVTALLGETADVVRVIILHDKQANGAFPAVADILFSPDIQSFKNLDNTKRFRTLYDRTIPINIQCGVFDSTSGIELIKMGENMKTWKIFRKLNIPIHYDGDAGTIGDIVSNNIVMLYISESGNVGLQATNQFRYLD